MRVTQIEYDNQVHKVKALRKEYKKSKQKAKKLKAQILEMIETVNKSQPQYKRQERLRPIPEKFLNQKR